MFRSSAEVFFPEWSADIETKDLIDSLGNLARNSCLVDKSYPQFFWEGPKLRGREVALRTRKRAELSIEDAE